MVYLTCDGGDEQSDCGGTQYHLNWFPPMRVEAVCVVCGHTTEIGGDNYA